MNWRGEFDKVKSEYRTGILWYMEKLDEYEAKIAELENQIEKMKHCNNCKYWEEECLDCDETYSKWEMDNCLKRRVIQNE